MISICISFGVFSALVVTAGDTGMLKARMCDSASLFAALAVIFMMVSNMMKYWFASIRYSATLSAVLSANAVIFTVCVCVSASNFLASATILIAVLAAILVTIKAFDVDDQTEYRDGMVSFYVLLTAGWLLHSLI